jgi:hypothetical protein
MRALAAALVCVACYNPTIKSGAFRCDSTNNFQCPDGFCCISGACVNNGCGTGRDGSTTPEVAGCSDGTREALMSVVNYPDIAACDGAWDQQGIVDTSQQPHCGLGGGNNGTHSDGAGCAAADLCAAGWHVCRDVNDVQLHHGVSACAEVASTSPNFYATRQRALQVTGVCSAATQDANNVNGCGAAAGIGIGYAITDMCTPLNRRLGVTAASATCPTPWNCGSDDRVEGQNLTKAAGAGGVLCCHD